MRKYLFIFLLGFFLGFLVVNIYSLTLVGRGEEEVFLSLISSAKHSIDISTYAFTNEKIARLLLSKAHQGVKIRILVNKEYEKSKAVSLLKENENITIISYRASFLHAKVLIVDKLFVVIGSHNLSYRGLNKNEELSLLLNPLLILPVYEINEWYENTFKRAFSFQ